MPEEIKKEEKEKKGEETEEEKKKAKITNEKTIPELLLHIKPSKLLSLLTQSNEKNWHLSALARETGQSYVYTTQLIKFFEKHGIIQSTNKGKKRIIKLTEKGEKIAKALNEIIMEK